MANPQRTLRIPDEEWNRWVAIASRSIPTDGTNATTMFVRDVVNSACDLLERGRRTANGLVVPTTRERIFVATALDKENAKFTSSLRLGGLPIWNLDTPNYEPPSWYDKYQPLQPTEG